MNTQKLKTQYDVTIDEYYKKVESDLIFCPEAKNFGEPTGSCDKKSL
ncbi:MAG TPA: hypothetical protein PK957_02020 [Candidatus Dojkabacteria bacterium]|nr:hypothetical protein [Candidatus Dojkabacteria bacterium]